MSFVRGVWVDVAWHGAIGVPKTRGGGGLSFGALAWGESEIIVLNPIAWQDEKTWPHMFRCVSKLFPGTKAVR